MARVPVGFPTIGVGDIDFVQRLGGPSFDAGDTCHDGIDNDGDGLRDGDDPDCRDVMSF
ncbi:MAG: hypothetical protein HUU22_11985 [Phycisphaerae bacterium]|nr:hypothetical protein [Phycisphaerae bacterium]NUQ46739.1 hypothetical protein [Phycisphaerae bacterium]